MRYLKAGEKAAGYHYHAGISTKMGSTRARTVVIHVDARLGAGQYIPLNETFQKIASVKLNNQELTHKLDYLVKDNAAVAFTFNLTSRDTVQVEGTADAV
jgi:hypothetical protein